MNPTILIAGIGNIFLGDDAFGCEVVKRLFERNKLPNHVKVVDYGIRGLDLAYALMDGYNHVILVDATQRGHPPGTLTLLEPTLPETKEEAPPQMLIQAHSMTPDHVLSMVQMMGGECPPMLLLGCEPATLGSDDAPQMGLSAVVAQMVEPAVERIEQLIEELTET